VEKSDYKDLLADSYAQESELKDILKTIKTMVHDEPNNMKLGKKIRNYFLNESNKATYIYESPDGGETVYRRRVGDYENREKL
tara:strand:- start:2556 stop:2804 length:249 start_codon:yes stop_codon:yes gene_type:complete